ncbi:DUF2235 domain-containing protein [uncultured Roseovarius sp.]|uniref:DUF2235 domain-containing protein n=1 Tax=uncultured Roseovarius sp. TaxID=293344 RepID=UPI002618D202|nr:DUF2235 domain-containing protein [uncultured Roseovarius sp.]
MKRILIFCDGTWNSSTIEHVTNVVKVYDAVVRTPDQACLYIPGVGTGGRFVTFVGKWANKIGGGAFGWGLNRNIKIAYAQLAEHYDPGDKIMIFGFSRGAYTARSLAGMIRKCGLPPKNAVTARVVRKAFRLYRKRGDANAPDKPHIRRKRKAISPGYVTSIKDRDTRNDGSHLLEIAYLGVWDTVGALGIPKNLLGAVGKHINRRHQFHDTDLTSLVKSARHAVALDERRKFYQPALWDNLDSGKNGGLNRGVRGAGRPYQQMWFIGDHRVLGGRSTARGLVSYGLSWIVAGAKKEGMKLKRDAAIPDTRGDATASAPEMNNPRGFYKLSPKLLVWRTGPRRKSDRHPSVDQRLNADPLYRPRSMASLRPDLWQNNRRIT